MQNLHLTFDLCTVAKSKVKISQNFVVFSEYMNFNLPVATAEIIFLVKSQGSAFDCIKKMPSNSDSENSSHVRQVSVYFRYA